MFRMAGDTPLPQAVMRATEAIALARARGIRKLLLVTNTLTGFKSPSVLQRYQMVHEWAAAADGVVRVALVTRQEMIDPSKFGITVATNIGFIADVFSDEAEALAWLARQ